MVGSCRSKTVELVRDIKNIYKAECLKHGKIYIGQTKNPDQVKRRFCGHRYDLGRSKTVELVRDIKNIIYTAECLKHGKIYIGQTKNPDQVKRRFCGHRYDLGRLPKFSLDPVVKKE